VIPSTSVGDSAFIGVTVRANGAGAYHFTRLDSYTFGVSGWLDQAFYINYLQHFSGIYGKRSMEELTRPGDERFALTVTGAAGSDRNVGIAWSVPSGESGTVSIAIYDMTGALVFSPHTSAAIGGETRYRFDRAGAYVVALLHGNQVVRTQKITIN
jgi:hypothetical protein